MTSTYSQQFSTPPSLWSLYPRIFAARKPALVPEGGTVPRLEARLSRVRIDARQLERYRAIVGGPGRPDLPLAYPHVLAGALHLAILGSARFPVGVLGLVHVANRIEQFAPIDARHGGGELVCWLQGHQQTSRGQEFELHTEWRRDGGLLWRECSRFLARRRGLQVVAGAAHVPTPADPAAMAGAEPGRPAASKGAGPTGGESASALQEFSAPAGLGRRYGQVAGDINPIHIADVMARAFGFRAAIAHGMWSLARCAAELEPRLCAASGARVLEVQFRSPVFLPAALALRSVASAAGLSFELGAALGARTHLAGSLRNAA